MIPIAEERIHNFERHGLGLFVHYGLYSLLGNGEWTQDKHNIPKDEYAKLADSFTAENFDSDKLVLMAKNAGAKYITLTSRHHDGFSLYDTKGLNKFDTINTGAKRDLIGEFVESCSKHGISPFLYHTTLDWKVESYQNDFKGYLEYLRESVKILCTQYGPLGGLWFDGTWSSDSDWEEDALYSMIRKYQPNTLIINNTGMEELGSKGNPEIDCVTFERGNPHLINKKGDPKYLASEMCEVLNDHWGYAANDINYKPMSTIITELAQCRRYGANLLLNIGPMGDGSIRLMDQAYLKEIGKWISTYSDAIYNVKPSNLVCNNDNFIIEGDNGSLYLFVLNLGTSTEIINITDDTRFNVTVSGLNTKCKDITWLDDGTKPEFVQSDDVLRVNSPPFLYGSNLIIRVAEIKL